MEIRTEIFAGNIRIFEHQRVKVATTEYVQEQYNSTPDTWNFLSTRYVPVTNYHYESKWVLVEERPATQQEILDELDSFCDDLVI